MLCTPRSPLTAWSLNLTSISSGIPELNKTPAASYPRWTARSLYSKCQQQKLSNHNSRWLPSRANMIRCWYSWYMTSCGVSLLKGREEKKHPGERALTWGAPPPPSLCPPSHSLEWPSINWIQGGAASYIRTTKAPECDREANKVSYQPTVISNSHFTILKPRLWESSCK